MAFTDAEKRDAADREVKYRRKVYPRLVDNGRMTRQAMARETAIMQEIADDYRAVTPAVWALVADLRRRAVKEELHHFVKIIDTAVAGITRAGDLFTTVDTGNKP